MAQDKYTRPDNTTQSASAYKNNIDNGFETFERGSGSQFQAHEQTTPDMTVRLEAGTLWSGPGNAPTEVAAQNTGTITAPSTNPRIDRVVVDSSTGTVSVITGSEAASPTAPAVTTGKIPIAYVTLATSTTTITDELITDERPTYIGDPTGGGSFLSNVVEDTNPILGADLGLGGNGIDDSNGNEMIVFTETASAVNHLSITNAATAGDVILEAKGDDTNIDLALTPKGSGNLVLDGLAFPNADGSANQVLQTDGAGALSFVAQSGGWTTVETQTISSATANVTFNTNVDSYTHLKFVIQDWTPSTAAFKTVEFSTDNGSTKLGGNSKIMIIQGTSTSVQSTDTTTPFNFGSTGSSNINTIIHIQNESSGDKMMYFHTSVANEYHIGYIKVSDSSPLDWIQFAQNTGNINSATITLYGM